jgi:hypothetical protein
MDRRDRAAFGRPDASQMGSNPQPDTSPEPAARHPQPAARRLTERGRGRQDAVRAAPDGSPP